METVRNLSIRFCDLPLPKWKSWASFSVNSTLYPTICSRPPRSSFSKRRLPQLNSTHSTWMKVHRPELKLTTASLHEFIRQLNATLIALRYRHVLFAVCSYFSYLFCKKSVQQLSMSSRESKTKRCFVYFQRFPKSTRCPIFMIFPGLGTLLKVDHVMRVQVDDALLTQNVVVEFR
jgi:hypothetical protein